VQPVERVEASRVAILGAQGCEMSFIFLALGLWRSWLGGGIGAGFPPKLGTVTRYLALAVICAAATGGDWTQGGVAFVALLAMARALPHGPMNRFPLGQKSADFILSTVGGPGGGIARYLAYAGLRYGVAAVICAGVLHWLEYTPYGPILGVCGLILTYTGCTYAVHAGARLPTFTHPGDEAGNMGELIGWTLLGLALALV
jgi:hypothetical protein